MATETEASLRELAAVMVSRWDDVPTATEIFVGDQHAEQRPCSPGSAAVLGGYVQRDTVSWVYRVARPGTEARNTCRDALLASHWKAIRPAGDPDGGFMDLDEPI